MTAPKIRPCPQCGNIYVELYSYENGWQHVECDECHYLGPGEGSQLQAIRSHNAAIADTHAQRGDGTKIASPFMSGGGADRQSPITPLSTPRTD